MKKLDIDTIFKIITVIIAILTFIFVSWSVIYGIIYCQKYIYAPIAEVPTICIIKHYEL